ncbi:MAG: DUF2877 domain-containing protein [Bacteroidia bacterium]|nr:MAG: DUF2877 domain-containing protein [Bacteroidia bacterium]
MIESFVFGDVLPTGVFKLHSRFRRVSNFSSVDGDMVFVTDDPMLMAGQGIQVATNILLVSEAVSITKESVTIGDRIIHRKDHPVYTSYVSFEGLDFNDFETRLIQLPEDRGYLFPDDSLLYVLDPARCRFVSGAFERKLADQILDGAEHLRTGRMEKGVALLSGAGKGLTPSGDDFLAGLLYAMHYLGFKNRLCMDTQARQLFDISKGNNLLVNSFLWHAMNYNYFQTLKNFVYSCTRCGCGYRALIDLLSVGATSGADLLTGYIFGIQYRIGI